MPVNYRESVLSCGLRVIAEVDEQAHTAALGFFVRTGARDEAPEVMGVSHFLEHMMFKGTPTRSSDDVNREFDAMGARSNAYTSSEMTAFHVAVLPERLAGAADVLADMMRPALRDDDFNTERGVILEEIAMYKDDPTWVLYERLLEEHYGSHPLAHRVLGTEETITNLRPDQMRTYFAQRYSADNTVIALSGRLDFGAACAQLDTLTRGWQTTDARRAYSRPRLEPRTLELRDPKVSRAYRMILTAGPGMDDDRRYAAWVATQLLGGPDNSRLHWALIEPGLAEEADVSLDPRDGIGDLRLFFSCDPERLDEVQEIVDEELAQVADAIAEADVQRIRAKVATSVTLAGERPEGRMHRLGRMWSYARPYTTLEQELERINAVTVDAVRESLAQFPWSPRTVGTMLPA
jgi:predicted Zn-dependent peptidase